MFHYSDLERKLRFSAKKFQLSLNSLGFHPQIYFDCSITFCKDLSTIVIKLSATGMRCRGRKYVIQKNIIDVMCGYTAFNEILFCCLYECAFEILKEIDRKTFLRHSQLDYEWILPKLKKTAWPFIQKQHFESCSKCV